MAEFESFNTVRPEGQVSSEEVVDTEKPTTEENKAVEEKPITEEKPVEDTPIAEKPTETVPDEFIDNFNKRYNTEYKADDDIKSLFTLPSKVKEYEDKLKSQESLTQDVEKYKKELEDTKTTYMSELLDKPRIRSAYIAEQLVAKYPDRDPDVLASVAMSDIDKMSDIDVLAKERKMRGSKSSLDNIKAVIIKELGVEADQSPEEWDSLVNTELEMKATDARERIKTLLKDIELPKTVTKEEREAQATQLLEDKKKQAEPFKEIFKKFDLYKNGEFEFVPPDEFKSKLADVFTGMFIDNNLDLNEENLATAELIKKALFVEEYLPKMLEVHEKQIKAKMKEEQDKLLNNDTPPNTATATDQETTEDPNKPGLSSFFSGTGNERATKF